MIKIELEGLDHTLKILKKQAHEVDDISPIMRKFRASWQTVTKNFLSTSKAYKVVRGSFLSPAPLAAQAHWQMAGEYSST